MEPKIQKEGQNNPIANEGEDKRKGLSRVLLFSGAWVLGIGVLVIAYIIFT